MLTVEQEKLSERIRTIAEQKRDKEEHRRKIEVFLQMLEEQNEYLRFDPYTFVSLVDKTVVWEKGEREFIFRKGMKVNSKEVQI